MSSPNYTQHSEVVQHNNSNIHTFSMTYMIKIVHIQIEIHYQGHRKPLHTC